MSNGLKVQSKQLLLPSLLKLLVIKTFNILLTLKEISTLSNKMESTSKSLTHNSRFNLFK